MCSAKCHFGPCPPCTRTEVTARCKCGGVRKQLPCAEVWLDGKQIVLPCVPECKARAAAQEVEPQAVEETLMVEEPPPPTVAELRERRREKQRKREVEFEERRNKEEKVKR